MKRAPQQIILKPALTEKSELLKQQGKYVFYVARDANTIEIGAAVEAIYNAGKKKDKIKVQKVNVISVKGKTARAGFKTKGMRPDRKKAVITLAEGQMLEDIGA